MIRLLKLTWIAFFFLSACNSLPVVQIPTTNLPETDIPITPTTRPIVTATFTSDPFYVVDGENGADSNPGSEALPWRTIQKAVNTAQAGDTIYIRGGHYDGVKNAWVFQNSGTSSRPITLSNYPGEQVVFRITTRTNNDHQLFGCWGSPKADHIRIIGTDVTPRLLSDSIESNRGIVMQGVEGEQSAAIWGASNCDYWEISGVDFIDVGYGIITKKESYQRPDDYSPDYWHVHDNRVYNYYRESGMQFNGNHNLIDRNEIYKVSDRLDTPYGCQLLNILGSHNVIKGNVLSRLGSTAQCSGISFEWDLADENIVDGNLIYDVPEAITVAGGDNNTIRNNIIYNTGSSAAKSGAISLLSFNDDETGWPCNEDAGSAQALLPPDNPDHPDYSTYYDPRDCHSRGTQIYNNTIHGFGYSIQFSPLVGEGTIIRNNVLSGWRKQSICFEKSSQGKCHTLPSEGLTIDHNISQGPFGFANINRLDFHLTDNSPLIDSGYDLGTLNPSDFDGNLRYQGASYDIGAYEFSVAPSTK